ncbi:hypothetical protein [Streptomyces sp. NPDC001652]|uniref:sodium:solute symporter family transporter n=1 Tax=Streptomyces sp. NPDC001652 TaxID=3154393 RepID=UPI00332FBD5A
MTLALISEGATSITAFLLVVVASFFLCLVAGAADDTVAGFLMANRSLGSVRNGLAMCGDFVSVTTLLIPVATIVLAGHDGMLFTASSIVAVLVLLLIAEPLRNLGAFTLGGILATRAPGSRAHTAGTVITLLVCVPLIVVQLKVAGDATAYLLGLETPGASQVCIALIGLLIVSFAAFGGMHGTSVIETAKVLLAFGTFATAAAFVLKRFDWDLAKLFDASAHGSGNGKHYFEPGQLYGHTLAGSAERLSVCLTLALGSAVIPPLFMRISASRTGRTARRSARNAVLAFAAFSLALTILGLGAAALAGPAIAARGERGYAALFLLSDAIADHRGGIFLTLFACAIFVTALGAVSGLTLSTAAALSRDLPTRRADKTSEEAQVRTTRWWLGAVGIVSVTLAVILNDWNILFFASYAAALAASTILPTLLYTLFWKSFTRRGLLATLYGGAACCLLLQALSLSVSGRPTALFPQHDFHWIPLENVALITIPLGFLIGWLTSRLDRLPPIDITPTRQRIFSSDTAA